MHQVIINRGRGPEIAGTRITVYDVLDYTTKGYDSAFIASLFRVSSDQVQAALDYIGAHKEEAMSEYRQMLRATPQAIRPRSEPGRRRPEPSCSREWPTCARLGMGRRTVRGILADNNVEGHGHRGSHPR